MHIIVIGANAAGMSAAAKVKRALKGSIVTVYEQGEIVSFGSCGLPYYIAGYFDDTERMVARTPEAFIASGIDLRLNHTVTSIDTQARSLTVTNGEGESFPDTYDKLIIATGASAVIPPFPGKDLSNIFTLRNLHDGQSIRQALSSVGEHAVIEGGGFIGLELAEALTKQGKSVRLIELEDQLMKPAVDREFSDLILTELEAHGVSCSLGERVMSFQGEEGKVSGVVTDQGTYPADLVILSVGVRPDTLFSEGSGIEKLPNGAIITDGFGRTSVEGVYAAGDCAAVPHMITGEAVFVPLATTANKVGRIIGEHIAGGTREYPGTLSSSCVKVFDLELGRTGLSSRDLEALEMKIASVTINDKNQTDYYPGQEDIMVKLTYNADTGEILSAQSAGKNGAVLRIDTIAMAIGQKATVEDLAMADLCYAPPFARTWDVMNTAGNVAVSKLNK